jgi:type I restriction enzyme S subunit
MQGIAQMHFGPTHLKTMKMLLPDSIDLQLEFDAFVKKVDLTKVKVQKAIDETQALFDSLMNEYFE